MPTSCSRRPLRERTRKRSTNALADAPSRTIAAIVVGFGFLPGHWRAWETLPHPASVRDLGKETSGQKVCDEQLEARGENVHITSVRARHVSVRELAAHRVAATEESGWRLAGV